MAAVEVEGWEAVERELAGDELVVMFSSTAGVWGNAGQSDYAYANAVLDGKARRRAGAGGRTLTINWPLWRDGGMNGGDGAGDGHLFPGELLGRVLIAQVVRVLAVV